VVVSGPPVLAGETAQAAIRQAGARTMSVLFIGADSSNAG
jgi:hypothetical protein